MVRETFSEVFNLTEVDKGAHEEEEAKRNGGSIDEILNNIPDGYRFCPYDYELVLYYLKNKLLNLPLPLNKIYEVNLYDHSPDFFAGKYESWEDKEWYFFTPRYRKYPNGTRPKREAGNGYWKATGSDRIVEFENKPVGLRKVLVYYEGKPPKGNKTGWIMHEYKIQSKNDRKLNTSMRLDKWVLCKLYQRVESVPKPRRKRAATVQIETKRPTKKPKKTVPFQSATDQQYLNPVETDLGVFPPMNDFVYEQPIDSHSNSVAHQNLFTPIYPLPNDWAALYGDNVYASLQDIIFNYPPDFWDRMDPFERRYEDS